MAIAQKWITSDGTAFDTKLDAEEYEDKAEFVLWCRERDEYYRIEHPHAACIPIGVLAKLIYEHWDVRKFPIQEPISNGKNSGP